MRSVWFGNSWMRKVTAEDILGELNYAVSHDAVVVLKSIDRSGVNERVHYEFSAEECASIACNGKLVSAIAKCLQAFVDCDQPLMDQIFEQVKEMPL